MLPISKNICKRLLFNFFNGSPLHGPKGFKVQIVSQRQALGSEIQFVFKSASLVLEQVPTCIRKPMKILLISQLSFDIDCFFVVLDGFRSFQIVLGRFRLFQVALDRFRSFQVVQLVDHFTKYVFSLSFDTCLISSFDDLVYLMLNTHKNCTLHFLRLQAFYLYT